MPFDLPSVKPPVASLDKTLYSDLLVALDYDLSFPPRPPYDLGIVTSIPQKTLRDYTLAVIIREFERGMKRKESIDSWLEAVAGLMVFKGDVIEAMRRVYPRCAKRLYGSDVGQRECDRVAKLHLIITILG